MSVLGTYAYTGITAAGTIVDGIALGTDAYEVLSTIGKRHSAPWITWKSIRLKMDGAVVFSHPVPATVVGEFMEIKKEPVLALPPPVPEVRKVRHDLAVIEMQNAYTVQGA